MTGYQQVGEWIKTIADKLPADRWGRMPIAKMAQNYRGKRQYVVGYSWSRPGASMYSGRVYECILGWGETFDEAFAKAKKRVEVTK